MGVVTVVSALLRVAAVSTAVSLVIGLWLAWLLVNRDFRGSRELSVLVTAALALPAPVICYCLLIEPAQRGWWGIAGAGVFSAAPMLVRAGRTGFASLDPVYGRAARSVGASDWRLFWRVEFPLVWRPMVAACALAFARVLGEFVVASLIAARSV